MIVARFADKEDLARAAERLRRQGGLDVETRTPTALEEDQEGEEIGRAHV